MKSSSSESGGRFGVLVHGAGWVSSQHIQSFVRDPRAEVVAISSRSLSSARKKARESGLDGIACSDNLEEALEHHGVDIVSICTPQHVHCENVLAAARARKHIVIEKPVGISLGELRLMRDAVREAGVKTVVSFVLRWNPLFRMLKALIADDALGEPYCVEADYLSHNGSWWSGWEDARTLEQGISAFLVAGCHAIDALRWFASKDEYEPADPSEVYSVAGGYRKGSTREYNPLTNSWCDGAAPMEYDGLEVAIIKFANGVIGKVSVNADCVMPYRFPIRVFGNKGTIFDNRIWSSKFPGQTDWITLPATQPDSSDVSHHPFDAQIQHFLDCVEQDRESHCNLEDAIKTHEIAFAALESQKSGKPVKLPLL